MGRRKMLHPEARAEELAKRAAAQPRAADLEQVWHVVARLRTRDPATGRMTRHIGQERSYAEAKERAKRVLERDDLDHYEACWIEWYGERATPRKRRDTQAPPLDIPLETTLI